MGGGDVTSLKTDALGVSRRADADYIYLQALLTVRIFLNCGIVFSIAQLPTRGVPVFLDEDYFEGVGPAVI